MTLGLQGTPEGQSTGVLTTSQKTLLKAVPKGSMNFSSPGHAPAHDMISHFWAVLTALAVLTAAASRLSVHLNALPRVPLHVTHGIMRPILCQH